MNYRSMVSNFKNLLRHSKTSFFGGVGGCRAALVQKIKNSIKWIDNFYKFNAHLHKIVNCRSLYKTIGVS